MYAGCSTATRVASSSGTPTSTSASRRDSNDSSSRPDISSGSCAITVCTRSRKKSTVAWLSSGGRRLVTSQREQRSTSVRISVRILVCTVASRTLS